MSTREDAVLHLELERLGLPRPASQAATIRDLETRLDQAHEALTEALISQERWRLRCLRAEGKHTPRERLRLLTADGGA